MTKKLTLEQLKALEERVHQLEETVCLAKAKCRVCGAILLILPTTEYVHCKCGQLFGDAGMLLAESLTENPKELEWIHKDGYEKELLMSHLRRDMKAKYPRAFENIPS